MFPVSNSVHIFLGELSQKLGQAPKVRPVTTFCGSGQWIAVIILKRCGFDEVEDSLGYMAAYSAIQLIADRYRSDPLSVAFGCNMEEFILEHQPPLRVHGHTHESYDYRIGETKVVCNPRGYAPTDMNKGFKADYVVEM